MPMQSESLQHTAGHGPPTAVACGLGAACGAAIFGAATFVAPAAAPLRLFTSRSTVRVARAGSIPQPIGAQQQAARPQPSHSWWLASGAAAGALALAGCRRVTATGARGPAKVRRGERVHRRAGQALMPWKIPNSQRYQWLSVRELLMRERILMVTEYIDDQYANGLLAMLLYLQSEDATKPIQIYFSSPGAQMKPALAVYDTICQLKGKGCKVTTVSYSLCNGMGALLVASGSPGRRFATPNSLFRLEMPGLETGVQGQAADIEVEARQMLKEMDRIEAELAMLTKTPLEKIQKDMKRAFYLDAAGAAEYGLVDRVLVPDLNKGKVLDEGKRDPWSGTVTKTKIGLGVFADPNQPRTAI